VIDDLIKLVREGFKSIKYHRKYNSTYSLEDLLSAGFAIFSLKGPSLLAFRQRFRVRSENLKRVFGIEQISREAKDRLCVILFANGLILNGKNQDLQVNYLEYMEVHPNTAQVTYFNSWITDFKKHQCRVHQLAYEYAKADFSLIKARGGRSRKLSGLTDEQRRCVENMAARFIRQLVDSALEICKTKKTLWEKVRQVFDLLPALSMNAIYRFIALNRQANHPLLE